jgi:hypothetical protein
MPSRNDRHRTFPQLVTRLLMVLGLAAGTLLVAADAASADPTCFDVYRGPYGTTVCTP